MSFTFKYSTYLQVSIRKKEKCFFSGDRPETAVLLFGPGEPELAHRPNESVGLERYYQAIDVFLDLLA